MNAYAEAAYIPVIRPDAWAFLNLLGNMLKPLKILEVGTAIGYSAILMCSFTVEGGKIDTIERDYNMVAAARNFISRAGLEDSINVIAGEADDILKNISGTYDMIFLDAAKGKYPEFLPALIKLLANGGVMIADNVFYKGIVDVGGSTGKTGSDPMGAAATTGADPRKHRTIVNRMKEFINDIKSSDCLISSVVPIGDGMAVCLKTGRHQDRRPGGREAT